MKNWLRRIAWRVLGPSPSAGAQTWDAPVSGRAPRKALLDLAMLHLQIATRNDDGDSGDRSLMGDYAEFGVFEGDTFIHACKRGTQLLPWMRFYAFDSFQGLPKPAGIDAGAEFREGQFACQTEQFKARLRASGADLSRVGVVEGWFDESLPQFAEEREDLRTVSLAFIDCDLYASTVPVLKFLTNRLVQGSILLFDDWFHFRADPARGVQRAVREWLAENPSLKLSSWQPFSHHGRAFFVQKRSRFDADEPGHYHGGRHKKRKLIHHDVRDDGALTAD